MSNEPTWREATGRGPLPRTLDELVPSPQMTRFDYVLANAEEYMRPDEIEAAVKEHDREVARVALRSAAELLRAESRDQNLARYTRGHAAAWLERLADG